MTNNWLNKAEYPFASNYLNIDGVNLHYIDEGTGKVLLFVHGTPSWSFDFRNLIKLLSPKYRCIAIDHIGFGLSDKPKNYNYSTQNHSKNLETFIKQKKLQNITLIVHDFGGPIGLNVAIHNPDRFVNFIILNSWLWSSETDPDFIKLSNVLRSPVLPFLYLYINFSPRFILPKSFGKNKLHKKLLKNYTKPFANKNQRYGALAFAKSLLTDQTWFESLWKQKEVINTKPTLFIWGLNDLIIKPHYLTKFKTGFKNTTTLILNNCGHFPQEENPNEVAEAIQAFLLTNKV